MSNPFEITLLTSGDEAIRSAEQRVSVLDQFYYNGLPDELKQVAFTVSYIAQVAVLKSILDELDRHISKGGTFQQFQKWAETAELGLTKHHLETVYRTNIQAAYMAGHWRGFETTKLSRPYLMYSAINDGRTRPSHRAMSGVIRPVGDPWFETHSPPCGFSCRCSLVSLTESQAMARSRSNDQGLNKQVTPTMKADEGFGYRSDRARLDALKQVLKDRMERVPNVIAKEVRI